MIPILIDTDNTILGNITDCTACTATEERNGIYEAKFTVPMQSDIYGKIQTGRFISAKPNDISNNQKFRIYKRFDDKIAKTTTFYCEHIRYKLAGIPVAPDTYSGTPASILSDMLTSVNANTEFSAWSDISTVKDITMEIPSSAGAMLAGQKGSLLDVFGGEFEFDNYTVKLHQNRGQEKKTEIRYRKNLTGFTCTEDTTNTYTHVYPFYRNEDGVYVQLDSKVITLANASNLPFERCYMLDLSAEFDTPPTKAQLQAKANAFINANDLDTVARHYKVSFVPLWQTEEYKNLAVLERCSLCDTVTVIHEKEKVKAKIIKTVYDVLNERYISIEMGNAKSNFAQTVGQQLKQVDDTINSTKSFLQQSIERQTKRITGNRGGYVVMNDDNQDGYPDEILIMNDLSIGAATKLWRANLSGIGYSSHGYTGPFELAMTMDGEINASMITTGSLNASIITTGVLNADLIKAGTISDVQGNTSINLQNGIIRTRVDNGKSLRIWAQGITMLSANDDILTSMYVSTGGLGIVTANRMLVGIRGSERVTISADSSNGYVRADTIYTDTISANANSGISVSNDTSITGALSVSNGASVTGAVSVSGNISSVSVSATSMITADYAVRSQRFALEKSNNTYENVLTVSNGNTLISSDIAEIKALKVYDTANSAFREFEFKRISVMNADTGNTELMRILVQKE